MQTQKTARLLFSDLATGGHQADMSPAGAPVEVSTASSGCCAKIIH